MISEAAEERAEVAVGVGRVEGRLGLGSWGGAAMADCSRAATKARLLMQSLPSTGTWRRG